MQLIITVDTEADRQKEGSDPITLKNLDALPRFQELCERYGMPPTYLITYEVAQHEGSATHLRAWQEKGRAEVGAHLHPWTTPPAAPSDARLSFPSALSDEELDAKFSVLTEVVERAVGRKPTSYRAGRWGFDARQERLLARHGYVADCSVTPLVDWRAMGGPDFRTANIAPYRLSSGVLEVPMTILYTSVLRRMLRRPTWLRIFSDSSIDDWRALYASATKEQLPVLVLMLHSSELALGTSALSKTEEQVAHMFARLEELFNFFREKGVRGATLSDFAKSFV